MRGSHPERALLVEGNGGWASLLIDILTLQGAAIAHVTTFEEASARLRERFCLIFTEVKIGRQRCFPFLNEILARGGNGPIIAISGSAPLRDIFLLKDYGVRHFIEYPVSRGKVECVLQALDSSAGPIQRRTGREFTEKVSAMEQVTLDCVLRGMTCKEIAAFRGVSVNTVKTQIRSLLTKMGASNQRELICRISTAKHQVLGA